MQDGAGLFCGVLRSFLARGADCPKVLTATHFHDVFREDLLDPALPITFLHMQILLPDIENVDNGDERSSFGVPDDADMVDAVGDEDENRTSIMVRKGETITYLYRSAFLTSNKAESSCRFSVARGLSLGSHAASCAQMFGLRPSLVRRARYVRYVPF